MVTRRPAAYTRDVNQSLRDQNGLNGPLSQAMRAHVHDLRNLFSVVASARHLLDRAADPLRTAQIAEALGRVAQKGSEITTELLSEREGEGLLPCQPSEVLRDVEMMLVPFGSPTTMIRVHSDASRTRIDMNETEFQAIALELVANALAAGARHIHLRGKALPDGYWLMAADDGSGCDAARVIAKIAAAGHSFAHGSGLPRIATAVKKAGGSLQIRSIADKGCCVGMRFPASRTTAKDQ